MSASGPAATQVGELPRADAEGPREVLDHLVHRGVDLDPTALGRPVVLKLREHGVGQEPEAPLAQLQAQHQGAVQVLENVAEASVDLGAGLADSDVAVERGSPDVGGHGKLPRRGPGFLRDRCRDGCCLLCADRTADGLPVTASLPLDGGPRRVATGWASYAFPTASSHGTRASVPAKDAAARHAIVPAPIATAHRSTEANKIWRYT